MRLRRRIGWLDLDRGAVRRWRGKREPTEQRLGSRNGVLTAVTLECSTAYSGGGREKRYGQGDEGRKLISYIYISTSLLNNIKF
jgi:hypothetical protein